VRRLAPRPLRPYRRVSEALSPALEPAYTRSVDEGPGSGNQVTILIAFELERNHTMNAAGIDVSAKTVTLVISREGRTGKPREFKNRLVPVDNSLIFINFMSLLRAKRTDPLTNRFFLLSIWPV